MTVEEGEAVMSAWEEAGSPKGQGLSHSYLYRSMQLSAQ